MHHPQRHNRTLPIGLVALGVIAAALPALALIGIFWREWQAFSAAWPWLAEGMQLVLFGSLAIAPLVALSIVALRWGTKRYIDAYHVEQLTLAQRSQGLPAHIQNLSFHDSHKDELAALPEPTPAAPIALSHESEWLSWTDQAPHLLVAGRTDSGKTTTVEAILARRIVAGDLILVIDPHYQAGKWLSAAAIGGGRDYVACYQTFDAVRELLDKRYASFNAGTRTEDFKRVTIIVDEVPAIIAHAQSTSKALYDRWLLFATSLGSEARKVRISVILVSQSPLVRDIGISSAMRENYARIALGDTAADLLREEPTPARKQALLDLLRGRAYPAAMEYRNNWYALRNDDIPRLAQTNGITPRAPSLLLPSPAVASPVAPQSTLAPTTRVQAPPTTQLPSTIPDQILLLLDGRGGYMTASEIAAMLGMDLQVVRVVVGDMYKAGQLARRECQGRTTRERFEYKRYINKQPSGPLVASA